MRGRTLIQWTGKGAPPLVLACQNPHKSYAAIQKLLTADIKVNKADRYGKTALHYVTPKALHIEALLKVGADVNARDIDGSTPLLWLLLQRVLIMLLNSSLSMNVIPTLLLP